LTIPTKESVLHVIHHFVVILALIVTVIPLTAFVQELLILVLSVRNHIIFILCYERYAMFLVHAYVLLLVVMPFPPCRTGLGDLINGFFCSQPSCGTPCASDAACRGADTCKTCGKYFHLGLSSHLKSSLTYPMIKIDLVVHVSLYHVMYVAGGVCSEAPSQAPSVSPSFAPSKKPSGKPSKKPSGKLTKKPSVGKSKKKMKRTKKPKVVKKTKKPKGETKKKKKY
jgi:hypothetical protein